MNAATVVITWLNMAGDGTSGTGAIPTLISAGAVAKPLARKRSSRAVSLSLQSPY